MENHRDGVEMIRHLCKLAVLLSTLPLSGCFRSSPPPQFYMLTALDAERPRATAVGAEPLVGLGPVRIPAYLDRDPIVTSTSPSEYHLSDHHRWAERLDVTLTRVSAANLARLIPTERIVTHPWPREPKPDFQVAIDLQDMYVDATGMVRFDALWTLRAASGTGESRRFSCRLPAVKDDYASIVGTESVCLARLNAVIAGAVRTAMPIQP